MRYEAVITIGNEGGKTPINEKKYRLIKQAHNRLLTAVFIEETFDIVLKNYFYFQQELLSAAARHMIFSIMNEKELHDLAQTMSAKTLNLLNSGRLYIDQTKHQLSRDFHSAHNYLNIFKSLCDDKYQNNLGYRAGEELRNYAQHRGLPVQGSLYGMGRFKPISEEEILFLSYTPIIGLSALKLDRKFKKRIVDDLSKLGDDIDLRWVMQNYVASLGSIHYQLRASLQPVLKESEEIIAGALDEYIGHYKEKDKFVFIVAIDDDGQTNDSIHLYLGSVERRLYLEEKNQRNVSLSDGCVIGQHIDFRQGK